MPVWTAQLPLPPVDVAEALRYAGMRGAARERPESLEVCLAACAPITSGRVCWTVCPVTLRQDTVLLDFATVPSASLARALAGCRQAAVFAATVGLLPDRLVRRFSKTDMTAALLMQGIGAERAEALCDAFCQKLAAEYPAGTRPRFSPGYGDLPLALQRDIFRLLDCGRTIGVTLGESLLMTPTKSVTAIVGLL